MGLIAIKASRAPSAGRMVVLGLLTLLWVLGGSVAAASASGLTNTSPPVISGSAQDGQTLTTTQGSWSGSGTITYRYQWKRCSSAGANCVNIAAATGSSYRLTSADVTHQVTVTVTATAGKLTGAATATPVGPTSAPPAPANSTLPVISGSSADGQTLTTGTGSWSSPDTLAYRYQWLRCSGTGTGCATIAGASQNTFKLTFNDVGHELTVVVTAVDKERQSQTATASVVGPVAKPPPPSEAALPVISGTAQDGQTVSTTLGSWLTPDKLSYARIWERCDSIGGSCVKIPGAIGTSYHLTSTDVGHELTVLVSATDKEGQSGQAGAVPVGPVLAPPLAANLMAPVVAGPVQTGQTLSVNTGAWSSPDPLTYSYQWRRCDGTGEGCADLAGQTTAYYTIADGDLNDDIEVVVGATDAEGQMATVTVGPVGPVTQGSPPTGIHKIQHVVIIMQENRSFDNYFGTFPGAEGIPASVCEPDPYNGGCVAPFHDTADVNVGGPHSMPAAIADIDGGAMDGFVGQGENHCGTTNLICSPCTPSDQNDCVDVMGYHDGSDLPNYWTYARDFVLQDQMFESVASWSSPSHLYTVSGWSARCSNPLDPSTCKSAPDTPTPANGKPLYGWTDITYLLHKFGVSWAYYVDSGSEPDCSNPDVTSCSPVQQSAAHANIWNPLPSFTDLTADGQMSNVQSTGAFYTAINHGSLPAVSWLIPNAAVSEHPPAPISAGQGYVTRLVNAIMQSPEWGSTAIFLSWDDWGGFYDSVVPPVVDSSGYGLRVPGLLMSPFAKPAYIDHQTLSQDAYLKFIEDDFLSGQRLDPTTDGRPDPRPDVRENAPQLGDLAQEFNFTQQPLPPVILSTCPQTDLTPAPTC